MEWLVSLSQNPAVEKAQNYGLCSGANASEVEQRDGDVLPYNVNNNNQECRNDGSKRDKFKITSRQEEARDVSPDSSLWSIFWSSFGPEERRQATFYDEEDNGKSDDDGSVVSSSGVSMLSIDYNVEDSIPKLQGKKVDLSDIGDDDESIFAGTEGPESQNETINNTSIDKTNSPRTAHLVECSNEIEIATSFMSIERNLSAPKQQTFDPSVTLKVLETTRLKGDKEMERKRKTLLHELRLTIATDGRYKMPVARVIGHLADLHFEGLQYEVSLTLYQEALSIYSSKIGDHDSASTDIMVRLGKVKEEMGEDIEALDFFCRALNIIVEVEGVYHVTASHVRSLIAHIYQRQERNKEAIKELKKALRGYREKYGDEHITVADTVDRIADIYTLAGTHDKAKSVRAELVKLRVALHDTKSIEVAKAIEKWAESHEAMGDINGALKVMKQAYVMYHDVVGPNCAETENALKKIGDLYSMLGRGEKALKAYTSVVVMQKDRFGDQSPEIADGYIILGKAFGEVGQYEKSLKAFNRAMAIFGASNGAQNTFISPMMDALHEIGIVYQKTEKSAQALKAFFKEYSIRKKLIRYDDIRIATTLSAIGATYNTLKKYEPSYNHYVEALQLYDKKDGRKVIFGETLFLCAESLRSMGQKNRAIRLHKEVLMIYRANGLDDRHSSVKKSIHSLIDLADLSLVEISTIEPNLTCSLIDNDNSRQTI